ncbi:MAG: flagellar brake protein, partial [Desulfarculaceae bacterium]
MEEETSSGVRLPSETGAPLLITVEGVEEPLKCVFAGIEENQYLIVRMPQAAVGTWQVKEGSTVTVRFISQGMVYGFHTGVKGKYAAGPLRFLFLDFPQSVETHNLRKS